MKFHESSSDSIEFSVPLKINNPRHPWYGVDASCAICTLDTQFPLCLGSLEFHTEAVSLLEATHNSHKFSLGLAANRIRNYAGVLLRWSGGISGQNVSVATVG